MDFGLAGKRALVLGGSRGLGAAVTRSLAAEGMSVVAASRVQPSTDERFGDRIEFRALDLGQAGSVDALADALLLEGGVDVLVNNSGGPPPATATEASRINWIAQFEAMAANIFHLTGRLLPKMIERNWGRIITIGSSGIEQPIPALALSNGIRAAVAGWSKTLAAEVASAGVTVNMVLPGRIDTERVRQLDEASAARRSVSVEKARDTSLAAIPVGRYGRPEEFAAVVAFLASEQASYVTGSMVRVDGGAIRSL